MNESFSVPDRVNEFELHSFHAVDEREMHAARIEYVPEKYLFAVLKREAYTQLYWACSSSMDLAEALQSFIDTKQVESLYIEFVPDVFLPALESAGFRIYSEWIDFWIEDLSLRPAPGCCAGIYVREYSVPDLQRISDISSSCVHQSRGFTAETVEALNDWLSNPNSTIYVASAHDEVIGYVLTSLYGFSSAKGAVVWIRELAVSPTKQNKGVGRNLLVYAMNRGYDLGARRSFLACDKMNVHAIRLYESIGYRPRIGRGQINMIYEPSGNRLGR